MAHYIQIKFDDSICGFVVGMPELITLEAIEEWKESMGNYLESLPLNQEVVMLIDTNKHQFESIQCLKSIREFFATNPVIQSNGVKAAFVQPNDYIKPHIKSENEAYFDNCLAAFKWLQEQKA